ncbi:hypothetical protein M2272_003690 [Mycobacterium frederiksbergense]|uniref:DUF3396 domain-containing protein n=1 Tax=Mycolicibacterium frederiksbergense TaxID=117567 RepID=A0ABT6L260_9MYCO|nr:hypothetical protein [Mycolicibacterium frederiksbergense]MDH6197037.1 hypothetical protein [Mycolicibacterium frederiksbergense]
MGNRANFVIVENGKWQLYYSHWAGCRMLDALAFGPEFAVQYIRALRVCGPAEWTDPLWADGGAVVDIDRKRLLFFGDELMCDMPIRRAMMNVLGITWSDYAVGWAYGGTHELAQYVDAGRDWDEELCGPDMTLARKRNSLCHVVSVVDTVGRLRLWPLWWGVSSARHGTALLELLPGKGFSRIRMGKIPVGGVHVDTRTRSVGVWYTDDPQNVFDRLPRLWSGWQTECWDDRHEEQVALCGRALRVPELDLGVGATNGLEWVRKRVFQSVSDAPLRPTSGQWSRFEQACSEVGLYTRSA